MDTFVGTPNYLSPEVIQMHSHSTAIDIWALGCILYKMILGRVAFPGTNKMQVYEDIKRGDIAWPKQEIQEQFLS